MPSVKEVAELAGGGDWSMGGKDKGVITELQDLGEQLGLNLKRDKKKAVNGKHCATEFGFGTLFDSAKINDNIVSKSHGTVKFSAGAQKFTADVDQIAIHKAGAHARIIVSKIRD